MRFLFFLVVCCLVVPSVSALVVFESIDFDDLPFEKNVTVPNNLSAGQTFKVVRLVNDSHTVLSVKSFYNASESIRVGYVVPFFVNSSADPFPLRDVLRFENEQTGTSFEVELVTNISLGLFNLSSDDPVDIRIVGARDFLITTFDSFLPQNISQSFVLVANATGNVSFDCAGLFLLECKNTTFLQKDEQEVVSLVFVVPNGTALGNYSHAVTVSRGNESEIVRFDVDVRSGQERLLQITNQLNVNPCSSSAPNFDQCLRDFLLLTEQLARKFLEEQQRIASCKNETVEVEKFVTVSSINPDLALVNERLERQNNDLQDDLLDVRAELLSCESEKENLVGTVALEKAELKESSLSRLEQLEAQFESENRWYKKGWFWVVLLAGVVVVFVFGYERLAKNLGWK